MRRTSINLDNNLGERKRKGEAAAGNDKTEPGTIACDIWLLFRVNGKKWISIKDQGSTANR